MLYLAGRGTEKSWSGDRQIDGLMQASDELRCSGMTIGAFSHSATMAGASGRAPAYQTAAEKRPGQWRRRQRKKVSNVHTLQVIG